MREILFRGKRMDDGTWEVGNYSNYLHSDGHITYYINGFEYEVHPETIGQYTGLMTNGQRIFEGDLVEAVLPQTTAQMGFVWPIMPVVFRDGVFGLLDHRDDVIPFRSFAPRVTFEVLGNIHDNPELLKEG